MLMGHTNAHEFIERICDFPKLNVFCAVFEVYGPFFFGERPATAVYLDMLPQWLMPQIQKVIVDFVLQQDEAPANFLGNPCDYLSPFYGSNNLWKQSWKDS